MNAILPFPPSTGPAAHETAGEVDGDWLDCLGDVGHDHAILLGPDIGTMCALIRRGCLEVTELQRNERPEPMSADLAVIPEVKTADGGATAVAHARRGLNRAGRILLRTVRDPSGRLGLAMRRIMALNGFSVIRLHRQDGRSVLSGKLPFLGPWPLPTGAR